MIRTSSRPALGLLLLACFASTSCKKEAAPAQAPPPPAVTVALPIQREVVEWDDYTGRTEAMNSVEVRARVEGYLEAVHFQDGALVKKGDLLFTIDPRQFQATLDHAVAELELAKVQLDLATSEWNRIESVQEAGAVTGEEIEQRRSKKVMADVAVRVAEAAVATARLDVEYSQITAPIDGRIGRKLVSEGNVVNAGPMNGTLLTTIVSVDPMYAYIDANEQAVLKYIHLARTGERTSARDHQIPARFALADEKEYGHEGIVDFVDNRIDATTGTMRARIVFSNPDGRLVPGLFLRVQVPGSGKYQALLVDDQAVGTDLSQRFVLTIGEKNLVQYVPVELGPLIDGLRVVKSGLDPNAKVIVNGLMRSRPGAPVTPQLAAMDPRERKPAEPGTAPESGPGSKGPSGPKGASGAPSAPTPAAAKR